MAVEAGQERATTTRAVIVESYLALLEAGERAPRAEQVAAHAGVGLRTVYNHFRDLEGLRAQAGELVWRRLEPLLLGEPDLGLDPAERLSAFLAGRVAVLTGLEPFAYAAMGRQFISEELRRQSEVMVARSTAELRRWFAPELAELDPSARESAVRALHAVTGWPVWAGLRDEQGLEREDALAVLRLLITGVLSRVSVSP